jgi:hypothetical protein
VTNTASAGLGGGSRQDQQKGLQGTPRIPNGRDLPRSLALTETGSLWGRDGEDVTLTSLARSGGWAGRLRLRPWIAVSRLPADCSHFPSRGSVVG